MNFCEGLFIKRLKLNNCCLLFEVLQIGKQEKSKLQMCQEYLDKYIYVKKFAILIVRKAFSFEITLNVCGVLNDLKKE